MTDVRPMLASTGTELPRGEDWVFEPKYDGIRVLAFVAPKRVALLTRNGLDKAAQFPEIVEALAELAERRDRPFVLDGEIVAMGRGNDEPLRFQELQGRMHVADPEAIVRHRSATPSALMVFDMLLDGSESLVTESWRVRRRHLAALLLPPGARSGALRLSDFSDDGPAMLREARARGWEGIMAKRADAPYAPGQRSPAWRKIKIEHVQEFVVGGWTEPRNAREHFGAVLLGYYDDAGGLVYAGHTGTGFTRASLAAMYRKLVRLERATSPFTTTPRTNQPPHWARPDIVVEIKFNEWTADGKLRQPVFVGVRDDKDPREVAREPAGAEDAANAGSARVPAAGIRRAAARASKTGRATAKGAKTAKAAKQKTATAKQKTAKLQTVAKRSATSSTRTAAAVVARLDEIERSGGDGVLELPTGALDVSKLDKIFFPRTKHTKGDIMRYYARMAPMLLPAIADRPLVMKRFPNGVTGKAFYQQKAPADAPESVRVESVSDEGLTTADRLIGGDLATLLYLVQLGAISVDPWQSRVQSVQHADYAIIDLDPGPKAPFARVVEVALEVKDVLDSFDLYAIPKTSGASGIHIVLPLRPNVPNDGARMIAELVATTVSERRPRIATIERSVRARPAGAVYVDFLQNIRGKTVAGVYSVRARPEPTVSTPLDWKEVRETLDPTAFTVDTVPERVARVGDLWAKAMKRPNSLAGVTGARGD